MGGRIARRLNSPTFIRARRRCASSMPASATALCWRASCARCTTAFRQRRSTSSARRSASRTSASRCIRWRIDSLSIRRATPARLPDRDRPPRRTGGLSRVVAGRTGGGDRGVSAPAGERRIPVMMPMLGEEEAQAAADAVRSGWVAQGPRVAEFEQALRRRGRRRARRRGQLLHHRAAPGAARARDRARATRSSCRRSPSSPPPTRSATSAPTPVFADVDLATGNLTVETIDAVRTARTRAVIAVHQGGVPFDVARAARGCAELGRGPGRGRRLRRRLDRVRRSRSAPARSSPPGRSTRAR